MADTHFKIVFEGQLRNGVELETAKLNLAQLFKSEPSAVEKLFSGKPIALKRGLTQADAQVYLKALNDAGIEARIEPDPAISLSLDEIEEPRSYREAPDAPAASPYAPPRAPVNTLPEYSELKVFSVSGRIGRVRYLAWTLVLMVAALVVGALCAVTLSLSMVGGGLLITVAVLAFLVVSTQISVQRLHDIGWSGWLLLLNLVPFVGSVFPLLIMLVPGSQGPNQYGAPQPPNTRSVFVLAWMWLLLVVLLIFGAVAGGISAVQNELNARTAEYEETLPYDDDTEIESAVPAAPATSTESGSRTFFKGEGNQ